MPGFISDSPLARGLIRIGDEAIACEDDAKLRNYFAEDYVFHGLGGDLGFEELRDYFGSLRAAFNDFRIVREQIVADGNFLAARNTFSGDFTGPFTYSPIGPHEPTGQHIEWEVISTFRYDDGGRLAEEWVQTDYLSLLTKLGVTTAVSAPQHSQSSGRLGRVTAASARSAQAGCCTKSAATRSDPPFKHAVSRTGAAPPARFCRLQPRNAPMERTGSAPSLTNVDATGNEVIPCR